jgi:putative membrane-bound dehydrogenase-like protein
MRFAFFALFLLPVASANQGDFPIVPDDLEVALFARDPLVRNPCTITFDAKGRLCVGMGPQYRAPSPDTPPDSVWILTDDNGDGVAEKRKKFATGFNAIQGLAWKGDWLWVANAPELTRVRDTDGDDIADEYIRVYTDLGNLEHALHGLNFGPDGRLYMSKGNSKGLTVLPNRIAPAAFRELWGVEVPAGTREPQPVSFTSQTYQKNYQDPRDDWGGTGGILRCNDDGSNLEIISRGFRNPWDISFDDGFNWLGTDNDQTMGDKIFAPFYGAHFGWGHSWSYDWKGDNHLPTAPSSGPLFEGSGAGVIHCRIPGYPKEYQDVFFISDWLNREVLIYRTEWDGAWRKPDRDKLEVLAYAGGGRSMPLSSGRAFDPVDIEMGPDGAIWITSWGRQYGAHYENKKLANEGRIYRFWPKGFKPEVKPRETKSIEGLITELGSHVPAWRTNAQEELIRRGKSIEAKLIAALQSTESTALETWLVWTLGRINPDLWFSDNLNQTVQSIRVAAFNGKMRPEILAALNSPEARIRVEAVIALRELGESEAVSELLKLSTRETDRVVTYAIWGALMDLLPVPARLELLKDQRPTVRLASLLGLLEEDALTDDEIKPFAKDPHPPISAIAIKRLGGRHKFEQRGRPLVATGGTVHDEPSFIPFTDIRPSSGRRYEAAVLRPGAPYYTDRDYRMSKVPPALEGLTFLRTACGDADAHRGITVSITLKYPSTVYLIDDARAENLPKWARGKWQPIESLIQGDDPKVMRVYLADFPAGPVTFGTNRDGITAPKGNYLVVVRPKLLSPDGSVATTETIVPLLKEANLDRGRDLFFSTDGANCASCHQVGRNGNNHAPDLTEIGSRADAAALIDSIINPSADIVEGFAAQVIQTKTGEIYSGVVLSETGRHLTIAMIGGATARIDRKQIKSREALHLSAMPPGFGSLLTSQQLADLTAWLLAQKKPEPITASDGEFQFRQVDKQLELFLGRTRIATYLLEHDKLTRRAFVNVCTPSGIQVTRNFPPRKPEDIDPGYRAEKGIIHPAMHPGLWMSFGWIDGNDYWRLQSKVQFEGYLKEPTATGNAASFTTRDRYLDKSGQKTICFQDTSYRFTRVPEGIRLDWHAVFYNDERDFTFGDQEESGLALRIASPLRVQGGNGRILNNHGNQNGAGTWGKEFSWIDYSGVTNGKRAGVLVIPDPKNPRPCWSHSRDYGALVSNPFPKQPRERREPYVTTTVKRGQRYQLKYTILIHESDDASFDPAAVVKSLQR